MGYWGCIAYKQWTGKRANAAEENNRERQGRRVEPCLEARTGHPLAPAICKVSRSRRYCLIGLGHGSMSLSRRMFARVVFSRQYILGFTRSGDI